MINFVNKRQTKEERNFKYTFARIMGFSHCEARRVRDFTWKHYKQFITCATPVYSVGVSL